MARRKKLINLRVPFFVPMWRRVALLVVLGAWTAFEVVFGNWAWAILAGGIGAYAIYVFFFDFSVDEAE